MNNIYIYVHVCVCICIYIYKSICIHVSGRLKRHLLHKTVRGGPEYFCPKGFMYDLTRAGVIWLGILA